MGHLLCVQNFICLGEYLQLPLWALNVNILCCLCDLEISIQWHAEYLFISDCLFLWYDRVMVYCWDIRIEHLFISEMAKSPSVKTRKQTSCPVFGAPNDLERFANISKCYEVLHVCYARCKGKRKRQTALSKRHSRSSNQKGGRIVG